MSAARLAAAAERLTAARDGFERAADDERRQRYADFIAALEQLNALYKEGGWGELTEGVKGRILAAVEEARGMQRQMQAGAADAAPSRHESAVRQAIVSEKPNVGWDDVAGLENAKKTLQEAVVLPARFPEVFVGLRQPWRGILLYGPPGTGKTHLARACASLAGSTFFGLSSADIISKYVGESEQLVKALFAEARARRPAIVFIDEVDALAGARSDAEHDVSRRVKTELMVQMQGVAGGETGVLVLGATNLPWALDPAIRRRFEKRIYVPLPDAAARLQLLRRAMEGEPHTLAEGDFARLAARTDAFSGSDLSQLIKNACYEPLRKFQAAEYFRRVGQTPAGAPRYMACAPSEPGAERLDRSLLRGDCVEKNPVCAYDFERALTSSKPTVCQEDLGRYVEWTREFGMDG